MCGIAGFIDPLADEAKSAAFLERMLNRIAHRGPDDSGAWIEGDVAIGHRRLSIIDMSPFGHQPMVSDDKRYVIAFNGEIYNHQQLRKELKAAGRRFRGHSDTEVLLALIQECGLESAVKRCIGMFAIVLWDRRERTLQFARDRFGEKPLYYGWYGGALLFGSELKALTEHKNFVREVDPESVALLLRFGYIPSPYSVYRHTRKLRPGTILTLRLPQERDEPLTAEKCAPVESTYWSHQETILHGLEKPFSGSFDQAVEELEYLLRDAVRLQMQADVPLGAFLSGGIDSSTIVAFMQQLSSQRVRTYSIGFDVPSHDEAECATRVAQYLGTDHVVSYVRSADVLNVIPQLPLMYDEPLGDSSQIPTYLVARLARRDVTVSLSGDGGDEIFCGYHKYRLGERFARLKGRQLLAVLVGALPWSTIQSIASRLSRRLGRKLTVAHFRTLSRLLAGKRFQDIAAVVAEIGKDLEMLMPTRTTRTTAFDLERPGALEASYHRLAMLLDRESYLPDDILTKVDRATMAVSLESRAPLLDHRIAEFSARLPMSFLVDGGETKRVLRHVLYRKVPRALVDRPKRGFELPLTEWLKVELRPWATELLASRTCEDLLNLDYCR